MEIITNKIPIDSSIQKVTFHSISDTIHASMKIGKVIGVWESNFLDGSSSFLSWKKLIFTSTKYQNSDIYFFVYNTDSLLDIPSWYGPYRNEETSLLDFKKQYIKIRFILVQSGEAHNQYNYSNLPISPSIDSLTIQGVISGTSSKFFTQIIDIGFLPKYLMLTSESDIPDGAIVRYGVTSLDTIDENFYQFFDKDKITKLNKMPITGNKIKLLIEMSGNSGDPIVIHEIATMFSGEKQIFINKLHSSDGTHYEYQECI